MRRHPNNPKNQSKMQKNNSYDGITNSKNIICQSIRNALATQVPGNSYKSVELFDPIDDPLQTFQQNFLDAGGKLVPFEMDAYRMQERDYAFRKQIEVYQYLKFELEQSRCNTILNTSPQLVPVLENFGIHTINVTPSSTPVDAVIVYSEFLIARTGSIVFSQRHNMMLYPSIKDLAKNVIVLGSARSIVPDFSSVCTQTKQSTKEENRIEEFDFDYDMIEIIRPTKEKDDSHTPANPQITLLLLVEM